MRKFVLASAIIAATPFLTTAAAQATPSKTLGINIQSGGTSKFQSATLGADGGTQGFGSVTVGNFTVTNVGTKLLNPDYIDLSTFDVSSGSGGTLVITLTGSGFTTPTGTTNFLTQFTGNVSLPGTATASAVSYIDNSHIVNNAGCAVGCTLLSSVALGSSAIASGTTTDPFALTEVITVNTTGASRLSLDASVTSVPEPMSLALLGTTLLGFGLIRRQQKQG